MDLLTAIQPKAVLFLGKCGGCEENQQGRRSHPSIAAIRGERYFQTTIFRQRCLRFQHFSLEKAISTTIRDYGRDYWTGTVYTTNRRVWEHERRVSRTTCAKSVVWLWIWKLRLFSSVGFHNEIPRERYF